MALEEIVAMKNDLSVVEMVAMKNNLPAEEIEKVKTIFQDSFYFNLFLSFFLIK